MSAPGGGGNSRLLLTRNGGKRGKISWVVSMRAWRETVLRQSRGVCSTSGGS